VHLVIEAPGTQQCRVVRLAADVDPEKIAALTAGFSSCCRLQRYHFDAFAVGSEIGAVA